MYIIKKPFIWLFAILSLFSLCCCSGSDNEPETDSFDISFVLPSSIEINNGGDYIFNVNNGKSPKTTDVFVVESTNGVLKLCSIIDSNQKNFTVQFPQSLETGAYNVYLKRDTRKKSFGHIYIKIVEKIDFTPDANTTIFGVVSSAEGPVKDAIISDGIEVTKTNEQGIYQLVSKKEKGYVFISVPENFEVSSEGVLPQFSQVLKNDSKTIERIDFKLNKVDNQDNYQLLIFGDMHLAKRNNDINQYSYFTNDINQYRATLQGEKAYGLTLGDMTWDLYWYDNNFTFPEYLQLINNSVKDFQIFHTIGNHDHDYKAKSEADAILKYEYYMTPSYYSFNLGKIHYIIMDDIDCSNYDGTTSRNYVKRLMADELSWIQKDLAYVDKSTPLVIAMHAQVFNPVESGGFKYDHDATSTAQFLNTIKGYTTHIVTGHTHQIFNVTPKSTIVNGENLYEHNAGSVCASWWWSGNLTPGVHISPDGTPGGYSIWTINGKNIQWRYKATGWNENYQFRSYDLNNVHFSMDDVPNMPSSVSASVKAKYTRYIDAYPNVQNNEVLINIWNWSDNWTLEVTDENGVKKTATAVWAYDPLHIAALSVKRFNNSSLSSTPIFITEKYTHFFKVKMDDPNTDLTITVKDEFGHTWTEKMARPKPFSTDAYKSK